MISSTDEKLEKLFKDLIVNRLSDNEFWEWVQEIRLRPDTIIEDALEDFEHLETEEKIEDIELIAKRFKKHRKSIEKELMVIKL